MAHTPSSILSKEDKKTRIATTKAQVKALKSELSEHLKATTTQEKDAKKQTIALQKELAKAQASLLALVPPKLTQGGV